MPLRLGYKASAEQFGPTELADFAVRRRAERVRLGLHQRPPPAVAARRRARARRAALARRGRRPHRAGAARHRVLTPTFRYHPAVIAQAFATLGCCPRAGSSSASARASRSTRSPLGLRVAGRQGAVRPAQGGGHADPAALDRGAGDLRRHLLPDREGHHLRPARAARCRSTSARPVRPRPGWPAGSPTGSSPPAARARAVHRHAAAGAARGRREGRPHARRPRPDDRGEGVLRPGRRSGRCDDTKYWAALALSPGGEERRRGPDRDAAAGRRAAGGAGRVPVDRLDRPGGARREDPGRTSTWASGTWSSTRPAPTRSDS